VDNNNILRRLRFTFSFNDRKMMALFAETGQEVTREQISDWLKRDDDPAFRKLEDVELATFLDGFIIDRRGRRDGPAPVAETRLTNNIVLRKLKIALELRDDDIVALLKLADVWISKPELSALFRKPGHRHYRECQDQFLRNFLNGLQRKLGPRRSPAG
jgi:uncharacterized protein YehS (DUF1456 family)